MIFIKMFSAIFQGRKTYKGRKLFKGGNYSREEAIQGRKLLIIRRI
jgi:hypothetical protein